MQAAERGCKQFFLSSLVLRSSKSPCTLPGVQAARLFGRIRQAVACQAAPATLKSAFLEPVGTQLAAELSVELLGRRDEDFMKLFTGGWHHCVATHVWLPRSSAAMLPSI